MEMRRISLISLLVMAGSVYAQTGSYPKAKVSFDDFKSLVAEAEAHRAMRLVDLDTFLKMSKEQGTIILDSRSDFRFERLHLRGAKHLSFTDFTQANLASVIPGFQTRVLIYCNNNFEGNQTDFASKIAVPASNNLLDSQIASTGLLRSFSSTATGSDNSMGSQMASQAKPIMMALNIPTYINLYGYGYHEVYELDELVNVHDSRIRLEGTTVQR
jgi:rhodanese-related sulfurtransferase